MIRFATTADIPTIITMLVKFADATPVQFLKGAQYNPRLVQSVLSAILKSGLILVSHRDDVITGMLIAQIVNDQWLPQYRYLKELAWWVDEEYRGGTDGYRLLAEFTRIGKSLLDEKKITAVQLTTLANKPIPIVEKLGWRSVETNFVLEI